MEHCEDRKLYINIFLFRKEIGVVDTECVKEDAEQCENPKKDL